MYMAPEQAMGHKLDPRADLFSFGSVLYQMVSGRPPFRAPSALAVLKRVVEEAPRPISEIIPEAPQWLCDIITKLHAKNPDERYQTAQEVVDDLAECEMQLKTNTMLLDFRHIPAPKPAKSVKWSWFSAGSVIGAMLLLGVIIITLTNKDGTKTRIEVPGDPQQIEVIKDGQSLVTITPLESSATIVRNDGLAEAPKPAVTPFDTAQAKAHQDASAKHLGVPVEYTNSIGMEFVTVPKGKSWLGGGKDKPGDTEVEIPADFYLGKYEVTQNEWEKVMGQKPSHFSRTGKGMNAVKNMNDEDLQRFPVEHVSWDQCQVFIQKLNDIEQGTSWSYRLPTQVEWEYACRGGPQRDNATSAFDFYLAQPANTLSKQQANIGGNGGLNRPCQVGAYAPNSLGLHDMHGNVYEWCLDPVTRSEGNPWRATRGGCFKHGVDRCHATHAHSSPPPAVYDDLGFRLARVPTDALSPAAK